MIQDGKVHVCCRSFTSWRVPCTFRPQSISLPHWAVHVCFLTFTDQASVVYLAQLVCRKTPIVQKTTSLQYPLKTSPRCGEVPLTYGTTVTAQRSCANSSKTAQGNVRPHSKSSVLFNSSSTWTRTGRSASSTCHPRYATSSTAISFA